jgi:hypothetical protein
MEFLFNLHVTKLSFIVLGGIVVSVLAIGHKVRGFKSGRGRWIFMGDKNPEHALSWGEVKPSATCGNILWHFKEPFEV